jgi:hypothetical protein
MEMNADTAYHLPVLLRRKKMRKYLSRLLFGSAMSASAFAFAAEPVSAPLVLSDVQMDVVTAGGGKAKPAHQSNRNNSSQNSNQSNEGTNVVVGVNPAIAVLSNGNVTSGNNSGQSNSVTISR